MSEINLTTLTEIRQEKLLDFEVMQLTDDCSQFCLYESYAARLIFSFL